MLKVFAVLLILHGIAHLVGFMAAYQLGQAGREAYKTTLYYSRFEIGAGGIRTVGVLWLLGAITFIGTGVMMLLGMPAMTDFALYSSIYSLVLCWIALPDTRIGLILNVVLIAALLLKLVH